MSANGMDRRCSPQYPGVGGDQEQGARHASPFQGLGRVATDQIMVMGYHFPFPAIGHVVRHDTAYRWEAAQWAW